MAWYQKGLPGFVVRSFQRETGVIGAIFRTVLAILSPTIAAGVFAVFGYDIKPWLWWLIPLTAFSVPCALLWRAYKYGHALETDAKPKVSISDPIETTRRVGSGNQLHRWVSLDIENTSTNELRGCQVKLTRLTNVDGKESDVVGQVFRLNKERYADPGTHTFADSFDLKGKGDKERIDIAMLNEESDQIGTYMCYVSAPSSRPLNLIPRKFFPHTLGIQVVSEKLRLPAKQTFKLYINAEGQLKLEKKF